MFHLQHALEREEETRQQLEDRVAKVEQGQISIEHVEEGGHQNIEKSVVVIARFIGHAVEEVRTLVKEIFLALQVSLGWIR